MCARVNNILDLICPHDFAQREFGDTAAIDLFVLVDYDGDQLGILNILDLASTLGVVAMIPSKHPKIVWNHFFKHWITPFGVRRRLIYDQGAEHPSASSDKSSKTWVASPCRQPPSLHSKTQSVNGKGENLENTCETIVR